jgi:hypothetical protein
MKVKVVVFLLATCLLALTAWLVHVPNASQADNVPEKDRDTVDRGLEYLIKNQAKDGHWEGDSGKHPVAMTGLVGLALLMERKIERSGGGLRVEIPVGEAKYSANVHKAVDWLVQQSQAKRDGLIFSEHPSETARYMQGHGMATLFLAAACEDERDRARRAKLTDVLTRAVKYIVKAQSSQGGWYDTSKVEGHDFATIAATVIQVQALQAAEVAGIPVPSGAINDGQTYLKTALAKYEAKPGQNGNRRADTAAALAGRCGPSRALREEEKRGEEKKDELRDKWLKYCQAEIPVGRDTKFGRDEFAHYYYAQAVFNVGGDAWESYRTAMFEQLKSSQNKDGSWPAGDGIGVGPVYATAVWCSVLQVDKRSHPLTRPPHDVPVD